MICMRWWQLFLWTMFGSFVGSSISYVRDQRRRDRTRR